MKKSAFTITTSLLLGALVFAGGCCGKKKQGCAARPDGAKAAAVVPHIGTNALAVIYQDYAKSGRSTAVTAFTALLERKQREFNAAVLEAGGTNTYPEAVRKYTEMTADEMFRFIYGVDRSELKWHVGVLEKFSPDIFDDEVAGEITLPNFYSASYSAKPLDLDRAVKAGEEIRKAFIASDPALSNAFSTIAEVISAERFESEGTCAFRISVCNPVTKEKLGGVAPVVTTLCDGHLVVLASSEGTLEKVRGLYAGKEPEAPADSAIARELDLPANVLFRLAVPELGKFLADIEKDEDDDDDKDGKDDGEDDDGEFKPEDVKSFRLELAVDDASTNLFFRAAAELSKEEIAQMAVDEVSKGVSSATTMLPMLALAKPELSFLAPLVQGVTASRSGGTAAVGISIAYATLEAVDAKALARLAAEAEALKGALPAGGGSDDDDENIFE